MQKASDILYLFTTFSIRVDQIDKALTYAKVGRTLFPDDVRHIETQAYALLLKREYQTAEDLLTETEISTKNLEYLRSRTAILLQLPKEVRKARVKAYLSAEHLE